MKEFVLAILVLLTSASLAIADGSYSDNLEGVYTVTSDLNFLTGSINDFGLGKAGNGIFGSGWGNDDGAISMYSGSLAGRYQSMYLRSNNSGARTTTLSGVATKTKVYMASISGLTQKIGVVGFGSSTAVNTAYAAGGANSGAFFRVDSVGAAANVYAVTKIGASETVTNTGILDSGTYRTFEIVATSSSIVFSIDGTVVATHSTNLPTSPLINLWGVYTKDNVNKIIRLEWIKHESKRNQ